ncbi:hypothetical protein QBC45DRAFT_436167 [Copromyces sp. CBS 386.78]|nr:hypothetical protein QBC45DRAFT_436167 [Copromyces sp. CBS 386.78]
MFARLHSSFLLFFQARLVACLSSVAVVAVSPPVAVASRTLSVGRINHRAVINKRQRQKNGKVGTARPLTMDFNASTIKDIQNATVNGLRSPLSQPPAAKPSGRKIDSCRHYCGLGGLTS